jgi:phosphonopyruvate decarboxylase
MRADRGPSLIHIRIAAGSIEKLGRPTVAPYDVARRFKAFLGGSSRDAHSPGTIEAAKEKAGV